MDHSSLGQTEENERHHSELDAAFRIVGALAVAVVLLWLFA